MGTFTLKIEKSKLDPYSKRQWGADVYCDLCGRGIPNRIGCQVVITRGKTEDGETIFLPIAEHGELGRDSVEWGSFVGSHCAKRIPKEYKISQRRVVTAWVKNGQP
jgi:hypothetical protein